MVCEIKYRLVPWYQLMFLTHLPGMAAISQMTFSIAFSGMKIISLKFVPKGPIDNKSALVQVMVGAKQVTSHYLNQCWPSSLMHICGTRGRWVKLEVVLTAFWASVYEGSHFTTFFNKCSLSGDMITNIDPDNFTKKQKCLTSLV